MRRAGAGCTERPTAGSFKHGAVELDRAAELCC